MKFVSFSFLSFVLLYLYIFNLLITTKDVRIVMQYFNGYVQAVLEIFPDIQLDGDLFIESKSSLFLPSPPPPLPLILELY